MNCSGFGYSPRLDFIFINKEPYLVVILTRNSTKESLALSRNEDYIADARRLARIQEIFGELRWIRAWGLRRKYAHWLSVYAQPSSFFVFIYVVHTFFVQSDSSNIHYIHCSLRSFRIIDAVNLHWLHHKFLFVSPTLLSKYWFHIIFKSEYSELSLVLKPRTPSRWFAQALNLLSTNGQSHST